MLRDDIALWNSRLCCAVVSEEQQNLPNLSLHAIFRIGEIVPDGSTDLSPQPPKSRSNVFPDRKTPSPGRSSIYFAPFRPVQTKNRPASLAVAGRSNSKMSLFLHANSPERLPLFRWLRALPGKIKELLSLRHWPIRRQDISPRLRLTFVWFRTTILADFFTAIEHAEPTSFPLSDTTRAGCTKAGRT